MTAVFPTIIAVLLGLSFEEFFAETAMPEESLWRLLLALPLCVAPLAAAELLFLVARRRFAAGHPVDIRRYARWLAASPLPLYAVAVFALGWPKIVVTLGVEGTVLVDHLVVLAPYFLLLCAALTEAARLRRPLRLGRRGLAAAPLRDVAPAVLDAGRHLALVLVPLLGLIVVLDVARDTPLRLYFHHLPLLSSAVLLFALFGLSLVYPVLFRYGMGWKPLVAGAPLRRRLEELAERLGFRCRDILYWPSGRPVLNAAIVGMLPCFRYVVLTEELCKRLTLDELAAVFAHEMGHGKRLHAVYYLLFSLAFLAALVPLGDWAGGMVMDWSDSRIDAALAAAVLIYLPFFALYWFVLFNHVSRRFELEADVYGVQATLDPQLFITTLEKVARLSRIERRRRAPRHFSIANRADFLRRAFIEQEPDLLAGFRRRIRLFRRLIVASSALILCGALCALALASLRGAGVIFLEREEDARAERALKLAAALRPGDMLARALLAEADLYRGLPGGSGASESWQLLEQAAHDLGPVSRGAVLDALRSGWGRALARARLEEALVLVARARLLNQGGAARGRPFFDVELEEILGEMAALTEALVRGNGPVLAGLVEHPPRWLRRADLRPALDFLARQADGQKSL